MNKEQLKGRTFVIVQGGSFNPPHYLHMRLFEMARDYVIANGGKVYEGVMSPVGDTYTTSGVMPGSKKIANAADRIALCEAAASDSSWVVVDPWESQQSVYIPTIKLLDHVREKYAEDAKKRGVTDPAEIPHPLFLSGADLLESMNRPKSWEPYELKIIIKDYGMLCVEREGLVNEDFFKPGCQLEGYGDNVMFIEQEVKNNISSTMIRRFFEEGKSVKYLISDKCIEYINEHGLYK